MYSTTLIALLIFKRADQLSPATTSSGQEDSADEQGGGGSGGGPHGRGGEERAVWSSGSCVVRIARFLAVILSASSLTCRRKGLEDTYLCTVVALHFGVYFNLD